MTDFMAAAKTKSGNIILPRGRMMYPYFYKPSMPQGETDEEKARFQCTVIFPAGVNLDALAEEVEARAVDKWGSDYKKKFKVKKPFLKTEDYPKMGELAEKFPIFVRCNSKERPQVVRGDMSNVDEAKGVEEVYPGRWARVSVRPWAYDHPTGGKGISLGLQNVQLLEHDDRLAGGRPQAQDEFEAIGGEAGKSGSSTDSLFE
jgi:hypothetical protein